MTQIHRVPIRVPFENLIKIFQLKDRQQKKKMLTEYHNGFKHLIMELKSYILNLNISESFVDHQYVEIFSKESDLMKIIDLTNEELIEIRKNNHERLSGNSTGIFPRITHILSFNYTDLAWLYNRKLKTQSETNYIHGTADKYIIFGYGDERNKLYQELEDSDNNEFLKFTKSFQYSFENNYHNLIRFIDADFFEVFVLGHSCGLSDRTMLNTIFENKNCRAIRVFFHRQGDKDNFMEIVQNISRHFKDKSLMRKRVLAKNQMDMMPQI